MNLLISKGLRGFTDADVAWTQRKTHIFDVAHSRSGIALVQYIQLPENGGWFRKKLEPLFKPWRTLK